MTYNTNYSNQTGGFSFLAIIAGFAVDVIGSLVGGFIISLIFMVVLVGQGIDPSAMEQELTSSVLVLAAFMFVHIFFTMAGAFIAATVAKRSELLHAGVLAGLSIALTLVMNFLTSDPSPVWYKALSILLTVPAALLGGYLRMVSKPKGPPQGQYGMGPYPPVPPPGGYQTPPPTGPAGGPRGEQDGNRQKPKWGGPSGQGGREL